MSSFSSANSGRRLKLAVIFLLTAAALLLTPFCFCRAETASAGTTTTDAAESTTQTLSLDERYEQELAYDREMSKKGEESYERGLEINGIVLLALLVLYTVSRLKLEKKKKQDEAPYAFDGEKLSPKQEKKFKIASMITFLSFIVCASVYLFMVMHSSDHYHGIIEVNTMTSIILIPSVIEAVLSFSAWKKKMERIKYIAVILINVCMSLYFIVKIIKL